jgi:hypothetical protein
VQAEPRLAVKEEAPAHALMDGTSDSYDAHDDAALVDPMALPHPVDPNASPSPWQCRGDQGPEGRHDGGGRGVGQMPVGDTSAQVAARLLAEILALDLGSLTPIRALTLLHDLQTAAREAVPWNDWMANLSGVSNQTERS